MGRNREGGGLLVRIGHQLSYQPKVEADHGFDFTISGPHFHEYFHHEVEVLIHYVNLNGVSVGGEHPGGYPL